MSALFITGDTVLLSRHARYYWSVINYDCPIKKGVVVATRPGLVKIMNEKGKSFWFASAFWRAGKVN